jgi:hypothetical protein
MPDPKSAPSRKNTPCVVLRVRGRDVVLPEGRTIVGRSDACRIILDDPDVSRRHAGLDVTGGQISVADLDSANGVQVNGTRIRGGSRALRDGDVLSIGNSTLRVIIRDLPGGVAELAHETHPQFLSESGSGAGPSSQRTRPTRVGGALDLIFRVGEQALNAGQVGNAERVLRDHLHGMRDDAEHGTSTPNSTRIRATAFALRLAHETKNGEWFDYVVDLLRACRVPCSTELVDKLGHALARVDAVDAVKLQRYASELRSGTPTLEAIRAARQVEELASAAARKQRLTSMPPKVAPERPRGGRGRTYEEFEETPSRRS